MASEVPVRYARCGDGQIAYAVLGDHPETILWVVDAFSAIDDYPSLPAAAEFLRRLQRFRRVILVNLRGLGLSDPIDDFEDYPEGHVADVLAVLDAAGAARVDIVTQGWASNLGIRLGVRHPDRVGSLVLVHPQVRSVRNVDFPWGPSPEEFDLFEQMLTGGVLSATDQLAVIAPSSANDPETVAWMDRTLRRGASPRAVHLAFEQGRREDVRALLPEVAVPTLVLSRVDNAYVPEAGSRWTAEQIPGARYVALPGADHVMFLGQVEPLLGELEEFLAGTRLGRDVDRRLLTVLFTDLVDSTGLAASIGDARWRQRLDDHDRIVRSGVARHGGRMVKSTGDGALATFDGPGPALRAAQALSVDLAARGLTARFAVHTGEVELRDEDIGGIAVHLAARVLAVAEPGQVLVTAPVPLLVLGSSFGFTSKGPHELRGIPGSVELFAVDRDPEEWG